MGQLMVMAGYSKATAKNPAQTISSKDFQDFLNILDDRQIIARWYNWSLHDTDKRVSLEAGEKVIRLKDRYPIQKLKLAAIIDDIRQLE